MAVLEQVLGEEALAELGLGVGIVVVPRVMRPVLRPAAKALIKAGIVLYRGTREMVSEATGPRPPAAPVAPAAKAPPAPAKKPRRRSKRAAK